MEPRGRDRPVDRHAAARRIPTKLRVQGGAYGGYAVYRPEEALVGFISYRDPHLIETLEVYRKAGDFVRSGAISADLLERSKIGAVGGFDRILGPGEQGLVALKRHLLGLTDNDRRAFRDGLLDVTMEGLKQDAPAAMESALAQTPRAVLAARKTLEQANAKLQPPFVIEELD